MVPCIAAEVRSPLNFLEADINDALTKRNQILQAIFPGNNEIDMRKWKPAEHQQALLSVNRLTKSSLTLMISGIAYHLQNNSIFETYLQNSLLMAAESPGETWLFFLECNRYQLNVFKEKALAQLEKQVFMSGARSSQVISDHLLQLGKVDMKTGNTENARYLFTNAHRFNRQSTKGLTELIMLSFPFRLNDFSSNVTLYIKTISESWQAQLSLIASVYSFLQNCCLLFMVFVTFFMACKYLPKGLHAASHWFPDGTPIWLRTVLACSIFFSLVNFGLLPLFWLISFMIWRYLTKTEMFLYGVVLSLVIFSPLSNAISTRLSDAQNPDQSLQIFSCSINERMTESQYLQTVQIPEQHYNKHLRKLFDASYSIKNGSLKDAHIYLSNPNAEIRNDPVADNLTGITYLLSRSPDSAEAYFQKVLSYDQHNCYALFNLSRCALLRNDATTSMDYLKKAAGENQELVNNFIQLNDTYFSTSWPPLRQVLFPDYSPSFFWSRLFATHVSGEKSAAYHWGLSFLGLPPIVSQILFILLTVILIVSYLQIDTIRNPKRLFDCKYCGQVICRKCTAGILCPTCSQASQKRAQELSIEASRNLIVSRVSTMKLLKYNFLNILVPGSGFLLDDKPRPVVTPLFLIATSGAFTILFKTLKVIPLNWTTTTETVLFLTCALLLHFYAGIRFIPGVITAAIKLKSLQNISSPKEH